MRTNQRGEGLLRSRWARAVAVALAAALLVPIPALALTFLGPWTVVQALTFHTPNVPQPHLVGFTDSGSGQHVRSTVFVNMGAATQPGSGASQITVQRAFQVNARNGETLALQGMVNTLFRDAGFAVSAVVGRFQGNTFIPVQSATSLTSGTVGAQPRFVHRSGRRTLRPLRPGSYVVRLTFFYFKGPNGIWVDFSPPVPSPNRFEAIRS